MGILKLGKKYRRMMADTQHLDAQFAVQTKTKPPLPLARPTAKEVYEDARDWFRRRGIALQTKSAPGKLGRMTTAYRKTLRVSRNWRDYDAVERAVVLSHERVHYRQRRQFGNTAFDLRYVTNARFRVAVETQAYRESLRAYRALGARKDWLRQYAHDVPNTLLNSYVLGVLDPREVRRQVRGVLNRELEDPT